MLVDGTSVGTVSTYTFSNVSAGHTIAITFIAAAQSTPVASFGSGVGSSGGGTIQNRVTNLVTNGNVPAATSLMKEYPNLFTPSNGSSEGTTTSTVSTSAGQIATATFTRSLTMGSKGTDVKELQQYLNDNGFSVAATGSGSAGNETTYFGSATRSALAKFQQSKGISPAAGYFWFDHTCIHYRALDPCLLLLSKHILTQLQEPMQ